MNRWLGNFWSRHAVLTLIPCLVVWIWVALPFPVEDPYKGKPRWQFPGHRHGEWEYEGVAGREGVEREEDEGREGRREETRRGARE